MPQKPKNLHKVQTFYSAAYWWQDCDPLANIIGLDPEKVERRTLHLMREEARDAYYHNAEPEDKRHVLDYLDELAWSGVHPFTREELIRDILPKDRRREFVSDIRTYGLTVI